MLYIESLTRIYWLMYFEYILLLLLTLPLVRQWTVEDVALWIKNDVKLPEYVPGILTNQVDGKVCS